MATTAQELEITARRVTDDEVASFQENGWVKIPQLLSPELTAYLLEGAQRRLGVDGAAPKKENEARKGVALEIEWFRTYDAPSAEDEVFHTLSRSAALGENAARLLGTRRAMRFFMDTILAKLPVAKVSKYGQPTAYHQDYHIHPLDRVFLGFWIALDEITPEQGAVEFYNGSQKLGPLGIVGSDEDRASWTQLDDCEQSLPNHFAPGDATAHHCLTVHGARENHGDRPRWAYVCGYFPADSRYHSVPNRYTRDLGLAHNDPIDFPQFPIVFAP